MRYKYFDLSQEPAKALPPPLYFNTSILSNCGILDNTLGNIFNHGRVWDIILDDFIAYLEIR